MIAMQKKNNPDFDPLQGLELDPFIAAGEWWWNQVKQFK